MKRIKPYLLPGLIYFLIGGFILIILTIIQSFVNDMALKPIDFLIPFLLGGIIGVLVELQNVRLRLATEELRASKEYLEKFARERTAELEETNAFLQRLSLQDELTGLATVRFFVQYIDREWRRAVRNSTQLSLIFTDIDDFKSYNEKYGRQTGDKCLELIALALRDNVVRPGDFVARFDEDKFVILLPDTNIEGALFVAERLKAKVNELKIPYIPSENERIITLSMGLATCKPDRNSSQEDLIRKADEALLQAKTKGANQIVTL